MKKFMALLVMLGICGVCLAPVVGCGDKKDGDKKEEKDKKADDKKDEAKKDEAK